MNDQTDYVSSQSECSDSNHEHEDTKLDNSTVEVDNPEVDNPEVDNPEVDNPKLDNLYQCNVTGMCKVSHKHRVQNHNINAKTS